MQDPEITAKALQMVSSNLPQLLVDQWPEEARANILMRLQDDAVGKGLPWWRPLMMPSGLNLSFNRVKEAHHLRGSMSPPKCYVRLYSLGPAYL